MIELELLRLLFNILKVYWIGSKKKILTEKITQKNILRIFQLLRTFFINLLLFPKTNFDLIKNQSVSIPAKSMQIYLKIVARANTFGLTSSNE